MCAWIFTKWAIQIFPAESRYKIQIKYQIIMIKELEQNVEIKHCSLTMDDHQLQHE